MNKAVRIWEDNFKILSKIKSKSERNALCFALISYGFSGEIPQDLKLNKNNLLLFEVLKNNFIAKKQGGAPKGNFNRCSTVEKKEEEKIQPLSENRKQKTENIPPKTPNGVLSPQGDDTPLKKFIKPKIEELIAYCRERNNSVDAERFWNFYESKGWKVGKNPMKDWRAAVRTWEREDYAGRGANTQKQTDEEFYRQLEAM